MEVTISIVAAVIAVIASLISGGVAAYAIVYKENKVSVSKVAERRSMFLDQYRSKTLEFVNLLTKIKYETEVVSDLDRSKFYELKNEVLLMTPRRHIKQLDKAKSDHLDSLISYLETVVQLVMETDKTTLLDNRLKLLADEIPEETKNNSQDRIPTSFLEWKKSSDNAVRRFCTLVSEIIEMEEVRVERALMGRALNDSFDL